MHYYLNCGHTEIMSHWFSYVLKDVCLTWQ